MRSPLSVYACGNLSTVRFGRTSNLVFGPSRLAQIEPELLGRGLVYGPATALFSAPTSI